MYNFSLQNFRIFNEKTSFELNNINVLVGKNNSGKTTLSHGLKLYLNNINNLSLRDMPSRFMACLPIFKFSDSLNSSTHIGTFIRALNNNSPSNSIVFSLTNNNLTVQTTVSRFSRHFTEKDGKMTDHSHNSIAPITKIEFVDNEYDVYLEFDFLSQTSHVIYNYLGNGNCFKKWRKQIESLRGRIERGKRANKVRINPIDINSIQNEMNFIQKAIDFGISTRFDFKSRLITDPEPQEPFDNNFYTSLVQRTGAAISLTNPENDKFIEINALCFEYSRKQVEKLAPYVVLICNGIIEKLHSYLPKDIYTVDTHYLKRSVVYDLSDKNDYLAQIIRDYLNVRIKEDDEEKVFIEKWMDRFEIGEDFKIENFGGECFKLEIIDDVDKPKESIPLLDKGVGSYHIMTILLKLATIMKKHKYEIIPPIIIIEEPEQNLHPKLQSLLADLLLEVSMSPKQHNKDSNGFIFIIETHSEYFVRKSQVIVKNMLKHDKSNQPFAVYYLEKGALPRLMKYQENGTFSNYFGEGFYDEAISLAEQIL